MLPKSLTFRPTQKMHGRDPNESHRVATPLELLFDLVFVVAISASAKTLHHDLVGHHVGSGLFHFSFGFFIIFWAWLNYAWFASAYDTDDRAFRLLTMVQMFGALVLAVSVSSVLEDKTSATVAVIGYVFMRLALAMQWLRAAAQDPQRRQTCLRYALGISLVQACWVARLWLPESWQIGSMVLFWAFELLVPVFAERTGNTPWHAHHIAERYSSFVIIVLGECILGTTNAVAAAINSPDDWLAVGVFGLGALGLIFAIWWLYFEPNWGSSLHHFRNKASFVFGYGHYFILASLASLGAGFEVATDKIVEYLAHKKAIGQAAEVNNPTLTGLGDGYVAMCLAVAVGVFLTGYTLTRWLMLDKHFGKSGKLWTVYAVAMGWLAGVVAVYAVLGFNIIWLGWLLAVAPLMMTLVCAKGKEFGH